MKIIKKREITFERERSVTIRFSSESAELFCRQCRHLARFLTVDEAAVLKDLSAREIFRMVEAGSLHFNETERGGLLVCFESLVNSEKETDLIEGKNQK